MWRKGDGCCGVEVEGGRKAVELTISLQGERVAAGVEGEREGGREAVALTWRGRGRGGS